ncbi:biotin/lipoyl-binding protein [Aquabacterium sp.]|uniref:biotin/lipoyl-binding protein n=1 Tax=Aquabacterium sp. TaxID=1872578 RepID=UPI002486F235|nr:biotin/lipoyl-binding protein [Aquabacterium sp.]MDI1260090.1 biotin/lipoyl-binding protein [Aquabacterium sp.]
MLPHSPLSSPDWHRVAALRPRLRPRVSVEGQWVRGQRWQVLRDDDTGQACRLNASAYRIAARFDGRHALQELWPWLDSHAEPPTQDDIVAVLRQLQKQHLVEFDGTPDFGAVASSTPTWTPAPNTDDPGTNSKSSLMAWRIPLGNPSRWLDRAEPVARAVFSVPGLLAWSLLMLGLLTGLFMQGSALQAHATTWMQTPKHLALSLVLYPFIKAIHEAAHALAVRRWGGQVREAGITLLMLMPVPYVDASAANAFRHAWQRMLVSAAGIMAELAMAALGLGLWFSTTDGLLHDAGFVVWFIACVSTLLFNANPLQRLDGYHVMTDALHLPNLGSRSKQWWQAQGQRWLTPQADAAQQDGHPQPAPGERPWLVAYSPLAWVYQMLLWGTLVVWIGGVSSVLGWLGAALALLLGVIKPAWSWGRIAWQAVLWRPRQERAAALRRAALLLVPLLALLLPWPDRLVVRGVVWAPDQALVRTEVDGLIQAVHHADGDTVKPGDLLVTLHNAKLLAQRERLAAQVTQAEQDQFNGMGIGQDAAQSGKAQDELQRLQAEVARLDEQIAHLHVRALSAGRLVLPNEHDLPGRYLRRGDLLGHVLTQHPLTVRVAVREADAVPLRQHLGKVSVRLSSQGQRAEPGTLVRDAVGATRQLPSAALSEQQGGEIQTDPQDEHHLNTTRPIVLMDVRLDQAAPAERLGERAWVRFDQGWSPPVAQGWRWARQRVDATFHPGH